MNIGNYILYVGSRKFVAATIDELKAKVAANVDKIFFYEGRARATIARWDPYATLETCILREGDMLRFANAEETAAFDREFKERLDSVLNRTINETTYNMAIARS